MIKSGGRRLLLIFLMLKLGLASITWMNPKGAITPDSMEYLALAETLEEAGSYGTPLTGKQDLVRPPIYPLLLAALLPSGASSEAYVLGTLANLVMHSVITWLVLIFTSRHCSPLAGLAAGWISALSPTALQWSLHLMAEIPFTLLIFSSFMILGWSQGRNRYWSILSGFMLGAAALTKPIAVVLLLVMGAWLLWQYRVEPRKDQAWHNLVLFLVGFCIPVLPWAIRNGLVHGRYILSSVGEKTIVGFNFAIVLSRAEGITRKASVALLAKQGGMLAQLIWLIRSYPLTFAKEQLLGIARVAIGLDVGRWMGLAGFGVWEGFGIRPALSSGDVQEVMSVFLRIAADPPYAAVFAVTAWCVLYAIALWVGVATGGKQVLRSRHATMNGLTVLAFVVSFALIVLPGAAGQARFRVPAEPFLAILAGAGVANIHRNLGNWMKRYGRNR